jgi:hypothetical protein
MAAPVRGPEPLRGHGMRTVSCLTGSHLVSDGPRGRRGRCLRGLEVGKGTNREYKGLRDGAQPAAAASASGPPRRSQGRFNPMTARVNAQGPLSPPERQRDDRGRPAPGGDQVWEGLRDKSPRACRDGMVERAADHAAEGVNRSRRRVGAPTPATPRKSAVARRPCAQPTALSPQKSSRRWAKGAELLGRGVLAAGSSPEPTAWRRGRHCVPLAP